MLMGLRISSGWKGRRGVADLTPQQRAENIARTYLNPIYGHGDAIEAIRVAQIENANVELEKRRAAEAQETYWQLRCVEAERDLKDHLAHVQRFLQEMYAVMVDPLEGPEGKVEDTCKTLLERAKNDREATFQHSGLLLIVNQLLDDIASLERTYAGSLWTTGAGYTLHPRVLELREAVKRG